MLSDPEPVPLGVLGILLEPLGDDPDDVPPFKASSRLAKPPFPPETEPRGAGGLPGGLGEG